MADQSAGLGAMLAGLFGQREGAAGEDGAAPAPGSPAALRSEDLLARMAAFEPGLNT